MEKINVLRSRVMDSQSVFSPDVQYGFIGDRARVDNNQFGNQIYQVLPVKHPVSIIIPEEETVFANAIGVGIAGRRAGRKAKREAKKSGASNKEARAAKKTKKAEYAEEGSRRKDVLQRRAEKLTIKANTKFGSSERKSQMKDFRKERRQEIKANAKRFVVLSITAPILGAALALMAINFRGMATKFAYATPAEQARMKKRWEKMGGKFDKFMSVAQNNKDKKPFMCAAKCKSALADEVAKKGAKQVLSEIPSAETTENYSNFVTTASISAAVALGGSLLASLVSMVAKKKETEATEAEVEAQDKLAAQEEANMSELEKSKIAEAEKLLANEANWKAKIMNDPNLSDEEKEEALRIYKDIEGGIDWLKIGLIVGGVVAAGLLVYAIVKSTSGSKQ